MTGNNLVLHKALPGVNGFNGPELELTKENLPRHPLLTTSYLGKDISLGQRHILTTGQMCQSHEEVLVGGDAGLTPSDVQGHSLLRKLPGDDHRVKTIRATWRGQDKQ